MVHGDCLVAGSLDKFRDLSAAIRRAYLRRERPRPTYAILLRNTNGHSNITVYPRQPVLFLHTSIDLSVDLRDQVFAEA